MSSHACVEVNPSCNDFTKEQSIKPDKATPEHCYKLPADFSHSGLPQKHGQAPKRRTSRACLQISGRSEGSMSSCHCPTMNRKLPFPNIAAGWPLIWPSKRPGCIFFESPFPIRPSPFTIRPVTISGSFLRINFLPAEDIFDFL